MANILPVKPVEIDIHGWKENQLRTLAREIAMDILPIQQILTFHGISELEWEKIARNPAFKAMLTSEVTTWNSALNTEERTKLKAQSLLEMSLLPAQAMINDKNEPASARVEMVKTIAKIAGAVDKVQTNHNPGEKFIINIGIGQKKVSVEAVTPEVTQALDLKDYSGE